MNVKKADYDKVGQEISEYSFNLKIIDEKLSSQTIVEKRRIDRGWEAEKESAKIKND